MAACGPDVCLVGQLYDTGNIGCSGIGVMFRLRMCTLAVYEAGGSGCFGEVAYALTIDHPTSVYCQHVMSCQLLYSIPHFYELRICINYRLTRRKSLIIPMA